MKKTILTLAISGFSLFVSAQTLDLGLKGGIASTWLLNQNVNNAGKDEDIVSSVSADYGLHLGLNFKGGTGIELEFISEAYNQKYKGTFVNPPGLINNDGAYVPYINDETYTSETTINEIKIPLLFHYESPTGLSVEVGPEYAIITGATYTANYSKQPAGAPSSLSYSTKSDFASSNFLPVIGFGWDIKLASQLYLLADIRFEYGLTDLIGTDGHGQDLNQSYKGTLGSLYGSTNPFGAYTYASYYATHSLEGSFNLGLFYRIPLSSHGRSMM